MTSSATCLLSLRCAWSCGTALQCWSLSKCVKPVMTTTNKSSVLKDVVAFVDVWSSEKTANYSNPFIEQLQEMGAQVSKTFNKQVTHVVFNNGHSATWKKAKKCNVHLVSILWIGRCYENAVHADEELYPAVNDESNPVLKNKRHRCMRPKDQPDKTPENDWRMRKKFDKMKKDLAPRQPVVTDVPTIFIDEENGIVYSPGLKRSDYMARRLKAMKDKRENLSPTASQMTESCSPTGLKPFLGSTPTHPKFMLNESDEESSASVAELDLSPGKEEGRTALHVKDPEHSELPDMKDYIAPWLSPCRDDPKQTLSLEREKDEDGNNGESRGVAVKSAKKHSSVGFVENASPDRRSSNVKNVRKQKSLSAVESENPKCETSKAFTDNLHLDTVKSPRCSSSSAVIDAAAAAVKTSKETTVPLQKTEPKTPRQARLSISALVKSFSSSSESKSVGAALAEKDDDVFEDFFSPANSRQKSKSHLLPNLPMEGSIHLPFELEPVLKKRKRTRESCGSENSDKKKRSLKSQNGKNISKAFDASSEPQNHRQASLPALDGSSADVTPITKRKRQNSSAFAKTCERSTSDESTPKTVANPESDLRENNIMFNALQSRGNECTVAAGFIESSTQAEKNGNKQIALSPEKMVHTTKAMRTLVMTSMPTEKQHTVVQVVKALGGFSIADRVCESTTHLVSGGDKRTLNILLGIARGCWILSFEWILWCLEQRQWIPEEPYELSDKFPAAQICRLQRHLSAGEHQQDLFQGQPAMFVSQHSEPPTHSLVELIELCGGTVCKTVRRAGICIGKYSGRRPEGSRILSEQWVLDSITHLKRLPYDNYDLE